MGTVRIPTAVSDYNRRVPKEARIYSRNRYFEQNPVLTEEPISMIVRPALNQWQAFGEGHGRRVYDSPGAFNGDLFFVSGEFLYRVDSLTGIGRSLGQLGSDVNSTVNFAATAAIGSTPEYLFFTDGGVLWVYLENGFARGILEASGLIADNDTVEIGGVYYKWTSGSVDAGAPAGTVGNPWLILFGGSNIGNMQRLYEAINGDGVGGVDYSTLLVANPEVQAINYTESDLYISAFAIGALGNVITTSVVVGANLSWGAATLQNGGIESINQIRLPDDAGAIDVAHINSYIIVLPVQTDDKVGRFYWIEPGAITIEPLNFATAERNPDEANDVLVFSNLFWLLGQNTTEAWQTTGDPNAPMRRFEGVLYDRGAWEGSAVQVKDSLIMVDEHGGVHQISGQVARVSTPDIEERIRRAMQIESITS